MNYPFPLTLLYAYTFLAVFFLMAMNQAFEKVVIWAQNKQTEV